MPDTTWPINRHPPGSSRVHMTYPLLMSSRAFRHVICGSLTFAFIGSHLPRSQARLFHNAQHERLLTAAPWGGLWPPPARRPRRATGQTAVRLLHLLYNTASRTHQPSFQPMPSFCVRGALTFVPFSWWSSMLVGCSEAPGSPLGGCERPRGDRKANIALGASGALGYSAVTAHVP
jgi:hypothetical protein